MNVCNPLILILNYQPVDLFRGRKFMKSQLSSIVLFAVVAAHAHAQTDVYLCVDEQGNKEYKNTGTTKGCKKVELPTLNMVPAPVTKKAMSSDFPKVDSGTQKSRDNDRRQILQDELKTEQEKLANLKKEFNNGE